jgi:hypothetical protein
MTLIEIIATLDWMMADQKYVPWSLLRPSDMHELNQVSAHFDAIHSGG